MLHRKQSQRKAAIRASITGLEHAHQAESDPVRALTSRAQSSTEAEDSYSKKITSATCYERALTDYVYLGVHF